MAEGLWMFFKKMCRDFKEKIETISKESGVELKSPSGVEIFKFNLWMISKALSFESEKTILQGLHDIYIKFLVDTSEIKKEDVEDFSKDINDDMNKTYKKYYDAWDDTSGGNQTILAVEILEQIFNDGKPDRKFINIKLTYPINIYILTGIEAILDFRLGFEII